ncbi:MAG TPA: hypothetical protein VGP19_15200 [Candidatus Acidoferrales bacterium]|nr:hypothetical protein [Candidatus Acidoferrales bacterium]
MRIHILQFELEVPSKSRGVISFSIVILLTTFMLLLSETAAAQVKTSSLGEVSPTFVGPAATGCLSGCSLLAGPLSTPATAPISAGNPASSNPLRALSLAHSPKAMPTPARQRIGPDPAPPSVSCEPAGPGCETISSYSGGAIGVKGLNAVDNGTVLLNEGAPKDDNEPSDQGLCAGNGYVVESNNAGEILIFNTSLQRQSSVIPLDTVMGLTSRGWSSGGDISCVYDHDNGGHWFFTEIVSSTPESAGGSFVGCFVAVANTCYEGIAVTEGSDPFGPYNVYFLNANYNPSEPGYPYLLNDFAKIAVTRDAFLLFYDEFPQSGSAPGLGGGFFNGAQEFAFNKNALEKGQPVTRHDGAPNPDFTVAIENMGLLPTPDGPCAGVTCWYQVIPALPPDPSQYDNSHAGSGFMLASLDFVGQGDTRIAVFDWTGLQNLNSPNCRECDDIRFGGQLFSGVEFYYGEGFLAAQKSGPIPLGNECGAAGLSVAPNQTTPPPASCPEGGIATNGDGMTQVSQAQGQLWGAISTAIAQSYSSESSPEVHQGAAYWVIGTAGFDKSNTLTLASQGYVSPEHEDLEFPAMAAEGYWFQDGGNGGAIMAFTLSGNGGPSGANHGGYFPSTAYGRLTATSGDLLGSEVYIADLGEAPEDGFAEYQGYPGPTRPRWGDYSHAIFLPNSGGKIYFATGYIQHRNCSGDEFTLTIGTCDGTRDGFANWGTSVNYVVP